MGKNGHDACSESGETACDKDERRLAKAAAKAAAKDARRAKKAEKKAWKRARPKREPWVSPILFVRDVRASAEYYEKAFGFEVELVLDGPDGKAAHAMLRHRRGLVMLGCAGTAERMVSPAQAQGSTVSLYVYVADVDALVVRAAAAGVTVISPPEDQFWGDRCARLADPEGHIWMFATHLGKKAREESSDEESDESAQGDGAPTAVVEAAKA